MLPRCPINFRPPMPDNYRLADASGPINQTMALEPGYPIFYKKTGTVTKIEDDRLIIDHMFTFNSSYSLASYRVHDKVLYECYDATNGALVIIKIIQNYGSRHHGPVSARPFELFPPGPRPRGPFPFEPRPLGARPREPFPPGPRPPGARPLGPRPPVARPLGPFPVGHRPPSARPLGPRPPGARPLGHIPVGYRSQSTRFLGRFPVGIRPPGARPPGPFPSGPGPLGDRSLGQLYVITNLPDAHPPGRFPAGHGPPGARPLGPFPVGSGPLVIRSLGLIPFGPRPQDDADDEPNITEHVLVQQVKARQGRMVIIKDSQISFDLNSVEGERLVPQAGDWVELHYTIPAEHDLATIATNNFASDQVVVKSLKPVMSRLMTGQVTSWTGEYGTCDHIYFFNRLSLNGSDIPTVGTKVMLEAIKSDQGAFSWRVTKLTTHALQHYIENEPTDFETLDEERERKLLVTHPLIFESVNIDRYEIEKPRITLSITNNSDTTYEINKWIVFGKKKESQVRIYPFIPDDEPMLISPGRTTTFCIKCRPLLPGNRRQYLIFMFKGFQVKRIIEINVVNDNAVQVPIPPDLMEVEIERKPIDAVEDVRINSEIQIASAVTPGTAPHDEPPKLQAFRMPDHILKAVLGDPGETDSEKFEDVIIRIEAVLPVLSEKLTLLNYSDRWHALLFLEEIQANVSMGVHVIERAVPFRSQHLFGLEIENLSERQPSLVKGGRVFVRGFCNDNVAAVEGYIHSIQDDLLLLKFPTVFCQFYNGDEVTVTFKTGRTSYRSAHQAVDLALARFGPDILFPTRAVSRQSQISQDQISTIKWFNEKLDEDQRAGVTNILLGECRPMPYCIYGPPGTGKTVTLIETIKQIVTLVPDSRILVATPSNSSADQIAEKLISNNCNVNNSMIRLVASYLKDSDRIAADIKPFCVTLDMTKTSKTSFNNMLKEIENSRVTIGTCSYLRTLAQTALHSGHFTHVILDEAGRATEPETMIPLTYVNNKTGQIILAGDPKQLGPVIQSKYSRYYGMEESYMSRILNSPPYQQDLETYSNGYNSKLIIKLNNNYRCTNEVLFVPSISFYDASLVSKVERTDWVKDIIRSCSEAFDGGVRDTGGIYVINNTTKENRAYDNKSCCNAEEAEMVAEMTSKLYEKNLEPKDIGIITPYAEQVKCLQQCFKSLDLPQPMIGTVEEFQGLERPVILLSTVGSATYTEQGFFLNPQRLNVALTRAMIAIYIFYQDKNVSKSPHWRYILRYAARDNKCKNG